MFRTNLVFAMLLAAGTAIGLDYWPIQPDGVVYNYRNAAGDTYGLALSTDGNVQNLEYILSHPDCVGGESYTIGADSIGLSAYGMGCQGGIDPSIGRCEPPLPVAWSGMHDGEYFLWEGVPEPFGPLPIALVTVTAAEVDVPLGHFEVLEVVVIPFSGVWLPFGQLYLDRDLGPVKIDGWDLVSRDESMATEAATWSDIKALYR